MLSRKTFTQLIKEVPYMKLTQILLTLLLIYNTGFAVKFKNYLNTGIVKDIAMHNDTTWLATNGGRAGL